MALQLSSLIYACLKFYMNSYRKPLFMYTYVFNMLVISNYNWLYAFLIIYKLLNKKNTNTFTSHCQSLNKFIGFFQSILTNVDSLLYVDTDILFLSPLEEIWFHFSRFNSTQLIALAPESEDRQTGWYNRFARHPYFGELGMTSDSQFDFCI